MTLYIGVSDMVGLIRRLGLGSVLKGVAEYIQEDFGRWSEFEHAPRTAAHSPGGVIELMPANDARLYAFKYVNSHPANPGVGLPTVCGFGLLADLATGYPLLLSEMTLATALRTAATSALAAMHLAPPTSKVMAIIGLGSQSEFQAAAFRELLGVRRLRVFDVDPVAAAKFVRNARALDVELEVAASVADAIAGAEIITTLTADNRDATVLADNHVGSGVHLNAVGGDCPGKTELQPSILARARTFVEFEAQTRTEGEIQQMPEDYPVTEIWRVLAGISPGRRSVNEITVFDSVGFALEDFATLRFLHDSARELNLGRSIDLTPTLSDPHDLFALVATASGQSN